MNKNGSNLRILINFKGNNYKKLMNYFTSNVIYLTPFFEQIKMKYNKSWWGV